jgi:hypothetical protein
LMALPEIMDKPIGADEIPKIATFWANFSNAI